MSLAPVLRSLGMHGDAWGRTTLFAQVRSVVVPAAVVFWQHGTAISDVCTLPKSPAICRIQLPGNGSKVVCPHALPRGLRRSQHPLLLFPEQVTSLPAEL